MARIVREVTIEVAAEAVHAAISDMDAIARWWTHDVRGGAELGDLLELGFYERAIVTRFRVEEEEPRRLILWRGVAGPEEYVGSTLRFELESVSAGTRLRLRHEELGGDPEFAVHAAASWERVLRSLKEYLETGRGTPIAMQ